MSEFAWITTAILGSTALGFLAGFLAASYEPPDRPLPYVEPPGSHVFVVPCEYNDMPFDGVGYGAPPEFYDWVRDGECVQQPDAVNA